MNRSSPSQARATHPRRITVEVERLVLDLPVSMTTGRTIGEAVESELARLIAEEGLPGAVQAGGGVPLVRAGAVAWNPGHENLSLARDLAHVVHSALGSSRERGPGATARGTSP